MKTSQINPQLYLTFNLSILECKCCKATGLTKTEVLLISPYWNVNEEIARMEAEYAQLLISPYWNVNIRSYTIVRFDINLLISPYWNVN